MLVALFLCATTGLAVAPLASADHPFAVRYTANQPGDITIVGNTVKTCPSTGGSAAACALVQTGQQSGQNNGFTMGYVDVDGDPSTIDSSRATLAIPAGATVSFAGLYWGGLDLNPTTGDRSTVKLRAPGDTGYTSLTGTALDTNTNPCPAPVSNCNYSNFANVTSRVAAAGSGAYTVADVTARTSTSSYGGWALVVVYKDTAQPARNLTVFDGYLANASTLDIPVSGFRTPPSGTVQTTLGVVSYEGDQGPTADTLKLNTSPISNALNPANDIMNSSITVRGVDTGGRTPNYVNQLGFDIDLFAADGLLANDATSATLSLTTNGNDVYLPQVATFSTELYAPKIVATKAVANVTNPGGPARRGDTLRYSLTFENSTAAGTDAATGFVARDPIPPSTSYVPGSLKVTAGPGSPATLTEAAGDDAGEVAGGEAVVRLGAGATSSQGGRLAAGASTTATFDVTVDNDAPGGGNIVNRATYDYRGESIGTVFPSTETNSTRTPVITPDLTISKSHDLAFTGGARTRFALLVANVGAEAPSGGTVTVTDTFPSGTSGFQRIENADGTGWSCAIAGLTLTCTRADALPAGSGYPPIYIDAIVSDPPGVFITNTATVSGGNDGNPANNAATDAGGAGSLADVSIEKTTSTPSLDRGDEAVYTLSVHNSGPSTANDVAVSDPMAPASYTGVTATTSAGTCDETVQCDLGNLGPGETVEITVTGTVEASATTLTNTATVATSTQESTTGNNSAEAEIVVAKSADLTIAKTGEAATATIGSPFAYTLKVGNDGPDDASELEVVDTPPPGFTGASASGSGWSCSGSGPIVCTRATLAAGADAPDIIVTGTPDASVAGEVFTNTASVVGREHDPQTGNNTSFAAATGGAAADIGVTKTVDTDLATGGVQTDPVAPATNVRFTLGVNNSGPSAAPNVTLSDTVPNNLGSLVLGGADAADCSISGQDVTCNFGTVANAGTRTITITATVGGAGDELLTNTANVDTSAADANPVDNQSRAEVDVTPSADVALTKARSDGNPAVGDNVTYTLTATNNGPSTAQDVTITDTLPSGVSFVSSSASCSGSTTVTCDVGDIADGDTAAATIVVHVDAGAAGRDVRNAAHVTSAGGPHDPIEENNDAAATISVPPRADLRLDKTQSAADSSVDSVHTYELKVTNDGPSDAEDVTITDPLPADTEFVDASAGCSALAGTVVCNVGRLANGDSATRVVTVRITPALADSTIINSAEAASSTDDPDPANNDDQIDTDIDPQVDLSVVKTANKTAVKAPEAVSYTLKIANRGPNTATGVVVDDTPADGLVLLGVGSDQGTCDITGNVVHCSLGSLGVGDSTTVTVLARIDGPTPGGSDVSNVATVDSNEPEARDADSRSVASVDVSGVPSAPVVPPVCARRPISLVRADSRKGGRVALTGLVVPSLAGSPVRIYLNYRGSRRTALRRVATVRPKSDGRFTATVTAPRRSLRIAARYQARTGTVRSHTLKLVQALSTSSVKAAGHEIVVRGRVRRSLLGGRRPVVVKQLVCGKYRRVGSARPDKGGNYTVRFTAPTLATVAFYRAEARVLARPGSRRYVTQYARAQAITVTAQTGRHRHR